MIACGHNCFRKAGHLFLRLHHTVSRTNSALIWIVPNTEAPRRASNGEQKRLAQVDPELLRDLQWPDGIQQSGFRFLAHPTPFESRPPDLFEVGQVVRLIWRLKSKNQTPT